MKTIKKIFWLILLVFIIYIILIFIKPVFADKIGNIIGLGQFNEKLRTIKKGIDIFSTKIPDKKEIEEAYSGAKNKIENLKENIDDIRNKAGELGEKYDETRDFLEKTGDKINKVKESLDDLEKVGEDISDIVNKDAIK